MPTKTTAQAEHSRTLLKTSALSRESGANMAREPRAGARYANSSNDPPMMTASKTRMNTPRVGSLANVWTEFSSPNAP